MIIFHKIETKIFVISFKLLTQYVFTQIGNIRNTFLKFCNISYGTDNFLGVQDFSMPLSLPASGHF